MSQDHSRTFLKKPEMSSKTNKKAQHIFQRHLPKHDKRLCAALSVQRQQNCNYKQRIQAQLWQWFGALWSGSHDCVPPKEDAQGSCPPSGILQEDFLKACDHVWGWLAGNMIHDRTTEHIPRVWSDSSQLEDFWSTVINSRTLRTKVINQNIARCQ